MKGVLLSVMVIFLCFSSANAQVEDTTARLRDTLTKAAINGLEISTDASEYVFYRNDSLILHSDGENSRLLSTYNCVDGTTVTTDGFYTPLNGAIIKLRAGDKVYKDGRIDQAK